MNIGKKISNFSKGNNNEFLALSFAYIGERLIKQAEENIFRPQKISAVKYNILCTLSLESPRLSSDISKFILGSAANFSAILGRMEKEGLITRQISKEDRREISVSITPAGKEKFSVTRKQFQEFFDEKFKNISSTERKVLEKALYYFLEQYE